MRRLDKKMLEWALFLSQTANKKGKTHTHTHTHTQTHTHTHTHTHTQGNTEAKKLYQCFAKFVVQKQLF